MYGLDDYAAAAEAARDAAAEAEAEAEAEPPPEAEASQPESIPAPRHHLSFSRRWLARLCLYWARPEVAIDPRVPNGPADVGTATHSCVEDDSLSAADAAAAQGLEGADAQRVADLVDAWRREAPAIFEDEPWQHEVAVAYDVESGEARVLPSSGKHRDYSSARPTEVVGTLDLVLVDPVNGYVINADVKTGYKRAVVEDHLPQLAAGAVALIKVHGGESADVAILHVAPEGVRQDWKTLDHFDLAVTASEMRDEVRGIPTSVPKPGDHCKWCPAKLSCPETHRTVEEVLSVVAPSVVRLPLAGAPASDEEARLLLGALPLIEAWVENRRNALKAYADTKPIDLGDGRRWGKIERNGKETFDLQEAAVAVLREKLGDAFGVAVSYETSKAAIERAVRRVTAGKRGVTGKMRDEVLAALREVGALKAGKPYVVFDEIKTKSDTETEVEE